MRRLCDEGAVARKPRGQANALHCACRVESGRGVPVLAAEYQTVLPDEKLLADEIQKTQAALDALRLL